MFFLFEKNFTCNKNIYKLIFITNKDIIEKKYNNCYFIEHKREYFN